MNQVAGKRRKVVRDNRGQGGKLTKQELLQFFNGMSNPDRDWFKLQFLGNVTSRLEVLSVVSVRMILNRIKLNSMHVQPWHLPRRTWPIRHVGRCHGTGGNFDLKEFFEARGPRERP